MHDSVRRASMRGRLSLLGGSAGEVPPEQKFFMLRDILLHRVWRWRLECPLAGTRHILVAAPEPKSTRLSPFGQAFLYQQLAQLHPGGE
jgi:hypothetical protein